jgi:uncharacterized damage-inducible protein DinB
MSSASKQDFFGKFSRQDGSNEMSSSLDEIRFWYNYNSHVRKRYLRPILAIPKDEALKDRGASHPSLVDIFVHVLDGYRFFFLRAIDHRSESEYDPWRGKTTLEQLKEREKLVDKMIMNRSIHLQRRTSTR